MARILTEELEGFDRKYYEDGSIRVRIRHNEHQSTSFVLAPAEYQELHHLLGDAIASRKEDVG